MTSKCINCEVEDNLRSCKLCKFSFCFMHWGHQDHGLLCWDCRKFRNEENPKCWNCSEHTSKLIPIACSELFKWRPSYGFVRYCEECLYWLNKEPNCPDCGERTIRQMRHKVGYKKYIKYKKPRFWCSNCKKRWRIKKKK